MFPNVDESFWWEFLSWIDRSIWQEFFIIHALVFLRLAGLFCVLPGLNHPSIPWQMRLFLVLLISGMLTPNAFERIKVHQDGTDRRSEIAPDFQTKIAPLPATPIVRQMSYSANANETATIQRKRLLLEYHHGSPMTRSSIQGNQFFRVLLQTLICCGPGELGLGLLLGFGAQLILVGFRSAGVLIDQQSGMGFGTRDSIGDSQPSTVSGEFLFCAGACLYFTAGLHLTFVASLLDTFTTFPPGYGIDALQSSSLILAIVQQSCSLALRLAAPVIATQFLTGIALSFASQFSPAIRWADLGSPLKLFAAFSVLWVSMLGWSDAASELLISPVYDSSTSTLSESSTENPLERPTQKPQT